MSGLGWPDLVGGAVLLLAALKGFKRGFVAELFGVLALVGAGIAAIAYPGSLDGFVASVTHAGPGAAHVAGLVLFVLAAYVVVTLVGAVLSSFARLPLIGIGNALLGAAVGLVKGAVLLWAALYVALFFPLTPGIRADLHRSQLVAVLTSPNDPIDGLLQGTLPPFARSYAGDLFKDHHV